MIRIKLFLCVVSVCCALGLVKPAHAVTNSPPTFIQEAETTWIASTSPRTTASFNVVAGDILVAYSVIESYDQAGFGNTATVAVAGGSLTWTNRQTVQVNNYTWVSIWTAVVDTNKSMTVSFTRTASGGWAPAFGGNVLTFRNSDGVGASNKTNNPNAAPTLNLTTTQPNSAIVVVNGDWNALYGGSPRAWRTNAGAFSETTYDRNAALYTIFGGYHADAGAAGTYAVGLTASSTQQYSIAAVEIKGSSTTDSTALQTWYASSSSFFVHHGQVSTFGGSSQYSYSTSTSFKFFGAGGGAAVGTSTSSSFGLLGGFLRNLMKGPAPSYEQVHYHWRNDDGSESAATSATSGTEDTPLSSLAKSTIKRLRIEIANKAGTLYSYAAQQFRLEYGLKSTTCGAVSSWTDVGAVAGDWDMGDSTNLTDGANTTNIAVSAGGVSDNNHFFKAVNGGVKDSGSQTASVSISSEDYIDLEYSIQALTAATDSGTYCFRVTNAGSATNYAYTSYPEVTIVGSSLTFSVDGGSEAFPNITPGTLVATTSILTFKTTNTSGLSVSVQASGATSTMSLISDTRVTIPDKTFWIPGLATTSAGNATASTTEPLTLQFRIRQAGTDAANYASTWWGSNDTTASALFAGLPTTTAQLIVNRSISAVATSTAYVLYNLNVPATQKTGAYSGDITYTVVANP